MYGGYTVSTKSILLIDDKRGPISSRSSVIYDKSFCHRRRDFFLSGGSVRPIFASFCYYGIYFLTLENFRLKNLDFPE